MWYECVGRISIFLFSVFKLTIAGFLLLFPLFQLSVKNSSEITHLYYTGKFHSSAVITLLNRYNSPIRAQTTDCENFLRVMYRLCFGFICIRVQCEMSGTVFKGRKSSVIAPRIHAIKRKYVAGRLWETYLCSLPILILPANLQSKIVEASAQILFGRDLSNMVHQIYLIKWSPKNASLLTWVEGQFKYYYRFLWQSRFCFIPQPHDHLPPSYQAPQIPTNNIFNFHAL